MAIINAEDLKVYLRLTDWDTGASAAAQEIIDGLEADLETYLGNRPLVETQVEDEVAKVDRRGRIHFKRGPVRSVTAVTVNGSALDPSYYEAMSWGVRDLWGVGISGLFGGPTITVSYVAGLEGEDPESLFARKARATLLRAAARDFNQIVRLDAAGVARLSVEGTAYEFHGGVKAGKGGLTDDEKLEFVRWKRRNGT